jgi:methyl-accepting chemotaxis protein
MVDELEQIPFTEIAHDVQVTVRELNRQLTAMNLPAMSKSFTQLSDTLEQEVSQWSETRKRVEKALTEVSSLAVHSDKELAEALRKAGTALDSISKLTLATTSVMHNATGVLQEDSTVMIEFSQTMQALREAAASVNRLATALELKPESLLFGRDK